MTGEATGDIKDSIDRFFKTISGILISPVNTYQTLRKSEPELIRPTIIALLFSALYAYLVSHKITDIILYMLGWLLTAGIFYGISKILRGKASFKRVLEFLGYAVLPTTLGLIIGIIFTSNYFAFLFSLIVFYWAYLLGFLAVKEACEFSIAKTILAVFIFFIFLIIIGSLFSYLGLKSISNLFFGTFNILAFLPLLTLY